MEVSKIDHDCLEAPGSTSLAGLLNSDTPSDPLMASAPVQLLAEQVANVSLVKDDDEYPEL